MPPAATARVDPREIHPVETQTAETRQIELSAGTLDYRDTGGDGPAIVFLHGLMMDASLWADVIGPLAGEYRCVAPTLPLGAHRHAMDEGADLSLRGIAGLVGEFLDCLQLRGATVVGNDTGGAVLQLLMTDRAGRVDRCILVACDAFDNFPPGLTGRTLVLTGKLPPSFFGLFMAQLRVRPLRRLPLAFGWLTKRGDRVVANWIKPILGQPEIRRDMVRVLRAMAAERDLMNEIAEKLPGFEGAGLVVWASEDRVMPREHGRRLADLLPGGRLVEVSDSYTLIPLDQPQRLSEVIRDFTPR
jgi:pimeloyl-ACP methyl ester carboxylesterase